MDNELLRNGSGYVDLTAYKAMKKIEDGGTKMKQGEIWEVAGTYENKFLVVVEVHDGLCSVLMLTHERKKADDVEIIAHGKMYTNPSMLSYTFCDRFITFVRKMREDEFAALMYEIDARFSMISFAASAEPKADQDEIDALKITINDLKKENRTLENHNTELLQ